MSLSTFQIIFNEPALLFTFKMKEELIPPQKAKTHTPIPNIPARQVVLSLSPPLGFVRGSGEAAGGGSG